MLLLSNEWISQKKERRVSDFSAKHYRMIARRLAESKQHFSETGVPSLAYTGIYVVERKLVELFEADNPDFDRVRFAKASEEKIDVPRASSLIRRTPFTNDER